MTSATLSLLGFAAVLEGAIREMDRAQRSKLEEAAVIVEEEAKRVLGTYDYGWPRLSPVTIENKRTGDSPGLETGEMRDSVEHTTGPDWFCVGSDEDKALWFELGTVTQPPRSFLAQAMNHKIDEVQDKLGEILVQAFGGT